MQKTASDGESVAFYWTPDSTCYDDSVLDKDRACLNVCDLVIDPPQTTDDVICTVTTAADSDDAISNNSVNGSLRWCIEQLNARNLMVVDGSRARIHFDMQRADNTGGGTMTIRLNFPLPDIKSTVTIDGTTQPYPTQWVDTDRLVWMPLVVLDGTDTGVADGILVRAPDVVLKGLTIQRFEREGVVGKGKRMRLVGVHVHDNGGSGISLRETAVGSVVGDPSAGKRGRVVTVGNAGNGIVVFAPATQIANVYSGIDADG